jgi:hypothetical protein
VSTHALSHTGSILTIHGREPVHASGNSRRAGENGAAILEPEMRAFCRPGRGGCGRQLQAEAYEKLSDSKWDKALQSVAVQFTDHPFLAVRTREIREWGATDQFQRLVQAIAEQKGPKCAKCGRAMDPKWKFCNYCGAGVTASAITAR